MRLFIGLQWLHGGSMGLVSRKVGVQRYYIYIYIYIYNLHHQATRHSLTLPPTSRWPGGIFDITGDN